MGCGRNGTFDTHPDWNQWAMLTVFNKATTNTEETALLKEVKLPLFIRHYLKLFRCNSTEYILLPIEGHGTWDKKNCFGTLPATSNYDGNIAILTRATIRTNKLIRFWSHVHNIAEEMKQAEGFICSVGIGELPFIKNGTFSIWENKTAVKNFAYTMKNHKEVVIKTRKENWYKEEMFVRFRPLFIKSSQVPKKA